MIFKYFFVVELRNSIFVLISHRLIKVLVVKDVKDIKTYDN